MKRIIYYPMPKAMIMGTLYIIIGIIILSTGIDIPGRVIIIPQSAAYFGVFILLYTFRFTVLTEEGFVVYFFAGIHRKINRKRIGTVELLHSKNKYYLIVTLTNYVPFHHAGFSITNLMRGCFGRLRIYVSERKYYATTVFLEKYYPDYKFINGEHE